MKTLPPFVYCVLALSLASLSCQAAPDKPSDLAASKIGADAPYIRYEAENGTTSGTSVVVGPNRTIGDLGGEASGRKAIRLAKTGDGVEWVTLQDANSIVIRNCVPDSADGAGQDASISLYINGVRKDTIGLTSKYAWLYGTEDNSKNTPGLGSPRHIYDESSKLLDFTIKKGDKVQLRKSDTDKADFYGIDFIELEMVAAPLPCPEGFVNLADEGITPENFGSKIAGLIQNFEWKEGYKEKKGLYIPPGKYKMASQALINSKIAPGFEIRGAGMWYTQLYNDDDADADWGTPGFNLNGQSVKFSDFAIFGGGRNRNGSGKPFFNSYGNGTTMTRLWIEHMACGFWVGGGQGVTNNLTIDSCRLRNLGADGINLCNGTKNSTVVNTTVRSTGDDGIAIWSAPEMDGPAGGIDYPGCSNNVVKNCTVELPWRANAYAIYGGKNNTIKDCIARDTLTYAGVNISSCFKPRPFEGTTLVENVLIERSGGTFWRGQQYGGLWIFADDSPIDGVVLRNIDILDPSFSGIMLKSETYNKPVQPMNVSFENVSVTAPGTSGILVQDAIGTANFKGTKLVNVTAPAVVRNKDTNGKTGTGTIALVADQASVGFPRMPNDGDCESFKNTKNIMNLFQVVTTSTLIVTGTGAIIAPMSQAQAATKFNREFAPQDGLLAPVERTYRNDICLNGSWQFHPVALPEGFQRGKTGLPVLSQPTEDGWDKTPIRIPSPWNVNSFPDEQGRGGDFRTYPSYPKSWEKVEMGWLRRSFTVPAAWKGKRLVIHFGAVAGDTQVIVNGKAVGGHNDIFMPFDVDITDAVQFGGPNTLLVGVRKSSLEDVQGRYGRRLYQGGSFWGQHVAGIWQDVFLEAKPMVHVDDVFVKPNVDKDTLEAQVTIRNDSDKAVKVSLDGDLRPWNSLNGKDVLSAPEVKWNLGKSVLKTNAATTIVPARGVATITISAKVAGKLKLWSPESPNLYGLICNLKSNGSKVSDIKYTRFGWRQITFQNGKVYLNGKHLILTGDSWHFMGIPQMTRRYAYAWYRACKDANLNAVRLHAQPYPSFYMDMADEMGFFILDESAIWASDGGPKLDAPEYWANTADHIKALVLRDRNHPSVFGWSVSNEVMAVINNVFHGPKEMQEELVKHFKVWEQVCRENDPTRPWISADGEDDGEGTLPTYVIHYGGPDSFKRALATGKPWGVGEAGPAYYGTPSQIAKDSGNPRSYLSFRDRMEGVATISYKNLVDQRKYDASFRSVFNLAWYALQPLELGMEDTTKPPSLTDGVFFGTYVEGKPGVQPERLGPYTTTLNPGYDPSLPLYATWPLFDAIRDSQGATVVYYKPAHAFTFDAGKAKLATEANIKAVRVLGGANSKLAESLGNLGVSVSPTGDASLLFVDGAQPPSSDAKATIQQTLDAGGTVFVWGADDSTVSQLNALLPLPLEVTKRTASSLIPGTRNQLTAGLTPASLYFSELSPPTILSAGLGGQFIEKSTPLLTANNTDWRTWNGQGEPIKTAMVMRSEREVKPSGVALAQLTVGTGRIVVSNLPTVAQTTQAATLNRTILTNLGVVLGDGTEQQNILNSNGYITRTLAVGRYGSNSVEEALNASQISPDSGSAIAAGIVIRDRPWMALESNNDGVFEHRPLNGINAQQTSSVYFSFWLNSPKDLANLLLDPHLPTLDLTVGSANAAQIWLNGRAVNSMVQGNSVNGSPLLLQQGWNHILVKAVVNPGANGRTTLQLRSSQPEYLNQLKGAQQILSAPSEKPAVTGVDPLDANSAKAIALSTAEKTKAIVISSERDEKGNPAKKFSVQGEWNYPGVWTTPGADKRAIWESNLSESGQYRIEIWYGDDPNQDHATNALVRVAHADGEKQTRLNLRQNTRQWIDLGTFRFEKSSPAKVILEGAEAGGNLLADLVKFTKVP